MDLFVDVAGLVVQQRRPVAHNGFAVTADGHVPRGGGQNSSGSRSRAERDSNTQSVGLVLAEVTLRLAVFAGCVYTSVRLTQFLGKLKERESQTATRLFLKAKLPARVDIKMDRLHFTSHEMAVAQVRLPRTA